MQYFVYKVFVLGDPSTLYYPGYYGTSSILKLGSQTLVLRFDGLSTILPP